MKIKLLWFFEFIIITVLSISVGWFYKTVLDEAIADVAHTNEVIDGIDELFILVIRSESAVKSYSTFSSQIYLDFYENSKRSYPMIILRLEQMVHDNPDQVKNLKDFHEAVQRKKTFLDEVIRLKQSNNLVTYQGQVKGKVLMDEIREIYTRLKTEEYKLLAIRNRRLENYADKSLYIIPAGFIINFILLVSSYYTIKDQ